MGFFNVCLICGFSWFFFLRKTLKDKPIPARNTECHQVFWIWTFILNAAEWSLDRDLLTEQNIILHIHPKALEQVRRLEKFGITGRFNFRSTQPAICFSVLGVLEMNQRITEWLKLEGATWDTYTKLPSESRFSLGRGIRTSEYLRCMETWPSVSSPLQERSISLYLNIVSCTSDKWEMSLIFKSFGTRVKIL